MTPASLAHWPPVDERDAVARWLVRVATSHLAVVGEPLMDDPLCAAPDGARGAALLERLHRAPFALLTHDGADDPRFTYGNLRAQALWELTWDQLVGMPSRLSAEADQRDARAAMLEQARQRGYIDDYRGVRISRTGQRFRIEGARIWSVAADDGTPIGQAARFHDVTPLP